MRRVVVTGLGVVSPLGSKVEDFWGNLKAGEIGIGPLTKLNPAEFQGEPISAEIKGAEELNVQVDEDLSPYGRAVEYATLAAKMSLRDAELPEKMTDANGYAVIIGTTSGNQDMVERTINGFGITSEEDDLYQDAAEMLAHFRPIELSSKVAQMCNFGGPNMVIPTACAAGNYAIGTGVSLIRDGETPIVLAGGADPFTRSCYTIFYRLGAMTQKDVRPFDNNRTGMVVGEGAAMLVLEDYDHAISRGARIYAEVSGFGLSCDAYHPTAPDPEGSGAVLAMNKALAQSRLTANDISYISAHGTGTKANDFHEVNAMYKVFGDKLADIPVNGIKSMVGHCMGAASALEAVAAVKSIQEQVVPPTRNTQEIDDSFAYEIDVNNQQARPKKIDHVMSNSFAFGGNICSVIFSKHEPAKDMGIVL